MWAVRYRLLLGLVLVFGSMFVAYWVTELLDGHVPLRRGSIGFLAAGLVMTVGDLGGRKLGGEGEGLGRYIHPRRGPSLRGIPVFAIGAFFIVLAVCVH